ncbi:MAG: hypothetical protein DRG78_05915 [Epsilonproteobacteria bacterium]|nr:MAG: hypothetical protein DRG78_05915 [Campylobacterota bacterium]
MSLIEKELINILNKYSKDIYNNLIPIPIDSELSINENVESVSGVYWIETTMPINIMKESIEKIIEKPKRIRVNPPINTTIIKQNNNSFYVVYSGTEQNINSRLKAHLFNMGHKGTGKLGCIINTVPFNKYQWQIKFKQIDDITLRYAVESWWRLNIGWPSFCLR